MTARFAPEHCCGCILCLYYVALLIRHQWKELLSCVSRGIMGYMNVLITDDVLFDFFHYEKAKVVD